MLLQQPPRPGTPRRRRSGGRIAVQVAAVLVVLMIGTAGVSYTQALQDGAGRRRRGRHHEVTMAAWAPFADPVPEVVWWSAVVVLLAASVAAALLMTASPVTSRVMVVVAAVLVAFAAGNQVNVFRAVPDGRALLALPAANQVDLPQVTRAASVLVTRPPGGILDAVWRPPDGMPANGTASEVAMPAPVSGFAARPAWVYLPPSYRALPRPRLPVLVLLAGQPGSRAAGGTGSTAAGWP